MKDGSFNSGRPKSVPSGSLCAACIAATCLLASSAWAQSGAAAAPSKTASASLSASAKPARKVSPYHPVSVPNRARSHYIAVAGVDELKVRRTNAGNLIRFSYRVTNPELAKMLADKQSTAYLVGQRSHAVLQVPVMDKVGQLRQTTVPQSGKEYWMVFSNKGDFVKAGERVSVVIGGFHADGLVVE